MVPRRAIARPRASLLLITLACLAWLTAGCGVEAGEESSPAAAAADSSEQTTTTIAPPTPPAGSADVDRLRDIYTALGFTDEEAQCLAESVQPLLEEGSSLDPDDTSVLMDLLNECDISLSRMMELGEGTDRTTEGGVRAAIEAALRAQGLTSEQASCVADAYIDRFGTDSGPSADPDQLLPLLEDCGA